MNKGHKRWIGMLLLGSFMTLGLPSISADSAETAVVAAGESNAEVQWTYNQETKVLTISGGTLEGAAASSDEVKNIPWADELAEIEKIEFSAPVYAGESIKNLFANYPSLQEIDLTHFDTSKTKSFSGLFKNSPQLKTLDVGVLDATWVTDISEMFAGCTSLETIDFGDWTGSVLATLYRAFYGCTSLEKLDLSRFNLSSVNNSIELFSGCTRLSSLVVSSKMKLHVMVGLEVPPTDLTYTGKWFGVSSGDILTTQELIAKYQTFNTSDEYRWQRGQINRIVFETNGAGQLATQVLDDGQKVKQPQTPVQEGYTFAGWYSDAAFTKSFDFSKPVTTSVNLYAKWEVSSSENPVGEKFVVHFQTDGGSEIASQIIEKGNKVTKPANPTKDGALFAGWFTDTALEVAYDFAEVVKNSFTLYGKWEVNKQPAVVVEQLYRAYNPNDGEHLYTVSKFEYDSLVALGWQAEGYAWKAPTTGKPIYRLYNRNSGEHFYTMSLSEYEAVALKGWQKEDVAFLSYTDEEVPVYRLFNPNATKAGSHHYTTSKSEAADLIALGWQDEGIAFYGVK